MSEKSFNRLILLFICSVFAAALLGGGYIFWKIKYDISVCDLVNKGKTEELKTRIKEGKLDIEKGCPFPLLAHFARNGNPDMVKFLIENGAEVEKKFTFSNTYSRPYSIQHTALFSAIHSKYEQKRSDFPFEINSDYIQSLQLLLKNGASLDTPCGRVYKEKATDSIIAVLQKESPDNQTAREIIVLMDHELLNTLLSNK